MERIVFLYLIIRIFFCEADGGNRGAGRRERMLIKKNDFESDIHWYDITDRELYMTRRKFIKGLGKTSVLAALALVSPPFLSTTFAREKSIKLKNIKKSPYSTDESPSR